MHPTLKKVLQYSLFLGLGIFLMVWQYQKMDAAQRQQFLDSISQAKMIYVLPIIVMAIASHLSRALRWQLLMQGMGYSIKKTNAFYTVMIGYLVNSFVPRAGEVVKCTMLSKREDVPFEKLIGTILIERTIDLLCYIVLIIATVLLQYNYIAGFAAEQWAQAKADANIHPLLKMGIYLAAFITTYIVVKWLIKKFFKDKIINKFNSLIDGIKDGFLSVKTLERKKEFWLHTLFIWAMYLLQIYVGFQAMQFTQGLGLPVAASVLTMGTLAMILTPGGMGAFPVAVGEVLALYNINTAGGFAFGMVIWGVSTAITLVVGIICLILFLTNNKQK